MVEKQQLGPLRQHPPEKRARRMVSRGLTSVHTCGAMPAQLSSV
jgi:hypothetical protein